MKVPRVIQIPPELHGIIAHLHQRCAWTDDRIAEYNASMLIELSRRKKVVEGKVRSVVAKYVPEGVASYDYDSSTHVVRELSDTGEPMRHWMVADRFDRMQLDMLMTEGDAVREAVKMSGLASTSIAEDGSAAMGEILDLVRQAVPQCASGSWSLDLHSMTAVEQVDERASGLANGRPSQDTIDSLTGKATEGPPSETKS
jgi:hypothetical protein